MSQSEEEISQKGALLETKEALLSIKEVLENMLVLEKEKINGEGMENIKKMVENAKLLIQAQKNRHEERKQRFSK